jgi:hypothetical protein
MKLIVSIFFLFFSTTIYSDYIRTGPVESDQGWFFIIGVINYQEVDSWEQGGKRYRFKTRYDDREIVEVVNNGTMCYSNTVRGNLYFKNKKLKFTDEIRFRCRYVR